jgi:hypothetical protein
MKYQAVNQCRTNGKTTKQGEPGQLFAPVSPVLPELQVYSIKNVILPSRHQQTGGQATILRLQFSKREIFALILRTQNKIVSKLV